jgi:hypothetical protein
VTNHNQDGGRSVALFPEHRPTWSREEQAQPRIYRSPSSVDDRDYRSWQERSYLDEERPLGHGVRHHGDARLPHAQPQSEQGASGRGRPAYEGMGSQSGSSQRGEPIGHRSESSSLGYAGYCASRGAGPHRGKGPVGYRRSDERIRELVCELLTENDQLDASQIEVLVSNGDVTLCGVVDDGRAKREAEGCACSITGVRDVRNLLRLRNEPPPLKTTPASRPPPIPAAKSQAPACSLHDKKPRT